MTHKLKEVVAVDNFGQILECYYDRLAAFGHMNPKEPKAIFAAMTIKDYFDNYPEFIKSDEMECLERLYEKAVEDSCLLSQAFIC